MILDTKNIAPLTGVGATSGLVAAKYDDLLNTHLLDSGMIGCSGLINEVVVAPKRITEEMLEEEDEDYEEEEEYYEDDEIEDEEEEDEEVQGLGEEKPEVPMIKAEEVVEEVKVVEEQPSVQEEGATAIVHAYPWCPGANNKWTLSLMCPNNSRTVIENLRNNMTSLFIVAK